MRKLRYCIFFFLAVCAAVVCACTAYSLATPSCPAAGVLPSQLDRGYVLSGWRELQQPDRSYSITLTGADPAVPLSLVLYDIGPFELLQNGKTIYRYGLQDGFIGSHTVPLAPGERLELILRSEFVRTPAGTRILPAVRSNTRLLLSTAQRAEAMNRFVLCVNAGTIGLYVLVIFYSLSLYTKKRSEGYLLLLCGLAVLALISSFTNSNLVANAVGNLKAPIRYLRLLLCITLSMRLMNISLPGQWQLLLTWRGMLSLTALLCLIDALGLWWLVDEAAYLSIVPCGIICIVGLRCRTPGALVLTVGTALREGMRLYYRLILGNVLATPEFFYYFYIPQFYNMLFVLCCIIIVNGYFARKFCEADALAERLQNLNQHLDGLVRTRTKELKQANGLLLEAQQRKRHMMTNIFHDLRTPIFCAQGSAEMITTTDEESGRRLGVLKDQLDYLSHMATELFALASIEERADKIEFFRIRSDVLCGPVAAAAGVQAEQKGIHLTVAVEPGLCFEGDAYQMKHALDNLLSNAFKFTPAGGEVRFCVGAREGNIFFEVADTGPGLTIEEQSHIFDRAYKSGGVSGFGLPIAAAIAAAHHGSIAVKSAPNAGATFTISIPLESN